VNSFCCSVVALRERIHFDPRVMLLLVGPLAIGRARRFVPTMSGAR
jgi:hypothetical protein